MVERSQPDRSLGAQPGARSGVPSEVPSDAWQATAAGDGDDRCRRGWARLEARRARLRVVVEADSGGEAGPDAGAVDRVAVAEAWLGGAEAALLALTTDLGSVPGAVVSDRLRRVSAVAERVQAAMARLAGALDSSAQWSVEGATSARAWLMGEAGVGPAAAGRSVAVGRLIDRFPATGEALAAGCLTASKAEILAAAALAKGRHRLYHRDEAVLLAAAHALDLHDFTLAVRRWVHLADDELDNGEPAAAVERRGVSFATLASGNLRVDGELDATGGALLLSAFLAYDEPDPVDGEIPPRTVAQRRADFLGALAARSLSDANAGASAPIATVDVVVDAEHLAAIAPSSPPVAGCAQHHDGHREGRADDHCHRGPVRDPGVHPGPGVGGDDQRGVDPTDGDRSMDPSPADGDHQCGDHQCGDHQCGADHRDPTAGAPVDGGGPPYARLLRWSDAIGTGPRPSRSLVQLLCDSWVGRVVMAGPDEPLAVGRRTRTWSAAQRRAIIARDGHCTHGRCTRGPEWCQIHHLEPWEAGGATSVDNGTLLCLWHHTHHHVYRPHEREEVRRPNPP